MQITMRSLESSDLAGCLALTLFDEQRSASQVPEMEELLEKLIPEEHVECKVIGDEGNIVGFAAYEHEPGATIYEILYFLIDSRWQGRGYGKEAFHQLFTELCSRFDMCYYQNPLYGF